ncbi:MAG: hypothetical protein AAF125_08115 [Chloroflexota bacterium]
MSSFPQDTEKLRAAARARDADQKQFLLKKMFKQLEFVVALGISAECVHAYADKFERYHPNEVWARRMLRQIVMTASAPDESIIQQAFQHFTTPGTANFFKALYDLYQGTQKRHPSEARVGFLVSAVENSLTAVLVEMYFGEEPEKWAAYRAQGEDFADIALAFWTDDAVAARDIEAWETVAERLLIAHTRTQPNANQQETP